MASEPNFSFRALLLLAVVALLAVSALVVWRFYAPRQSVPGIEPSQPRTSVIRVPVASNFSRLLKQEDTDGDGLITVLDSGPRKFRAESSRGNYYLITGTHPLGNLLEQLGRAQSEGRSEERVLVDQLYDPAVRHLSRVIQKHVWRALTRKLDGEELALQKVKRIYVPEDDDWAFQYYQSVFSRTDGVEVLRLPKELSKELTKEVSGRPGVISMAFGSDGDRRTVPLPYLATDSGSRLFEASDAYFQVLGLLSDGRFEPARFLVEHLVYQIEHYGRTFHTNHTKSLSRPASPYLTSAALAVHGRMPRGAASDAWLERALHAAIHEYKDFWTAQGQVDASGLTPATSGGSDACPPELDSLGLNALLYKYETDIARALDSKIWRKRAQDRKEALLSLMYDPDTAVFHDYDFQRRKRSDRASPSVWLALWAGLLEKQEAGRVADAAVARLEAPGGLIASRACAPSAWPQDQMLAWEALDRYGFSRQAQRLRYRWLYTLGLNGFQFNNVTAARYDAAQQSFTRDFRLARSGRQRQALTAASLQNGIAGLKPSLWSPLTRLLPPSWLFGSAPILNPAE